MNELIYAAMVSELESQMPNRELSIDQSRLIHATVGVTTEGAEMLDALKKHLFYGKPLDRVNLVEEIGDTLWYLTAMCDILGVSMEQVRQINHDKLRKRYTGGFTPHAAINRNLEAERKILEQV